MTKSLPWVILLLLLSNCANYRLHRSVPSSSLPNTELKYSIFSVANLGEKSTDQYKVLRHLIPELKAIEDQSSLLVLGDLVGPKGFLDKSASYYLRQKEEKALNEKLDIFKQYQGKIFFIPGDHEYGKSNGSQNLKRLSKYIEKYLDRENLFFPEDECSGPDIVNLRDDIALFGINSAWYLSDWNKDLEINNGCEFKDRHSFMLAVADEITGLRDQTVVMAMHHPLSSTGNWGGQFTAGQHLFPFRNAEGKGLPLPLPIVGTGIRLLQEGVGNTKYLSHPIYKDFVNGIIAKIEDAQNLVILSGHDHILQHSKGRNYDMVISGSAVRNGPAGKGDDVAFAYGAKGYARTDFYEDGSVWLRFIAWDENQQAMETVYEQRIIENRFAPLKSKLSPIESEQKNASTELAPVYAGVKKKKGVFNRFAFGEHYRQLYYTPISAPRIQLDTLHGGLFPFKRGGGMQTMSLRLLDPNERVWDMRSIRKNPSQLLPYPFDLTFMADVLRDQFTAAHPFGAFAVPPMAKALDIYHMQPKLAFVPKHLALGKFNASYGDELYMIQERPDEDWTPLDRYGNSRNIISSASMLRKVRKSWKKQMDQESYLRARLLDAILGDWDRHPGQWRWTTEDIGEDKDAIIYRPIAKDRDQVFSHFDGAFFGLVRLLVPASRKLLPYNGKLSSIKWFNYNARWNDHLFLNELSKEDWLRNARDIERKLTDEVLMEAIASLPDTVASISLNQYPILKSLQDRRAKLVVYASKMHDLINKNVNIIGTNNADYFEINREVNGDLHIRIYDANEGGRADELYYDRTFKHHITKEIVLYGLEGDDHFRLLGEGRGKIRLRVVGGLGEDSYQADSGKGPSYIYDSPEGIEIVSTNGGERKRLTKVRSYNQYNFQEFDYGWGAPYPFFGFDPTDGLQLGAGATWRSQGFKKEPFAQEHNIQFSYASQTHALVGQYKGTFINSFGYHDDLTLSLRYRNPNYTINYFGLGNQSEGLPEGLEREFNFVRIEQFHFSPGWRARFRNNGFLAFNPVYEFARVGRNPDRFAGLPDKVPNRVFNQQHFVGFDIGYQLNTLSIPSLPDQGLDFQISAGFKKNLTSNDRSFYRLESSLSFYYLLFNEKLQVATRLGYEQLEGDFEFYQAAQLGGRTNLRGFATERFFGDAAFFQNIDLRLRIFNIGNRSVPSSGGLLAGFDYGRVWLEDEDSNLWHTSIGGGLWFAPFNATIISATVFQSEEERRIMIGLGFPF